jgi:hypothetical protein
MDLISESQFESNALTTRPERQYKIQSSWGTILFSAFSEIRRERSHRRSKSCGEFGSDSKVTEDHLAHRVRSADSLVDEGIENIRRSRLEQVREEGTLMIQ